MSILIFQLGKRLVTVAALVVCLVHGVSISVNVSSSVVAGELVDLFWNECLIKKNREIYRCTLLVIDIPPPNKLLKLHLLIETPKQVRRLFLCISRLMNCIAADWEVAGMLKQNAL